MTPGKARWAIHLETVKSRLALNMKPVLDAKLQPDTKEVVTDALTTYQFAIPKEKHTRTVHKEELRDNDWTSTQTVENAFSLFKRGIVGNYHQLSRERLNR